MIDYALRRGKGYGLVVIDGIRDLMLDINSTSESVEVINKMMEWSSKYDLHIHCVLHQNKGDNNVRGHIGTEMNNKAETVLVISKDSDNPGISEVHALHIREKEFKPFAFTIDEAGLRHCGEPCGGRAFQAEGTDKFCRPEHRAAQGGTLRRFRRQAHQRIREHGSGTHGLLRGDRFQARPERDGQAAALPDRQPEADTQAGQTVLLRHDPRRSHAVRRGMTAGAGIYNIQFNLVQIYIGKQTKLNWFHENK